MKFRCILFSECAKAHSLCAIIRNLTHPERTLSSPILLFCVFISTGCNAFAFFPLLVCILLSLMTKGYRASLEHQRNSVLNPGAVPRRINRKEYIIAPRKKLRKENKKMENALDLMELFSASNYSANYMHAKATKTCIRCQKSAGTFRNAAARAEYRVSALCQQCQDECFRCLRAQVK